MIKWFTYYLFFLVILSCAMGIYITKVKIVRPFRIITFMILIMVLPFMLQFIIYFFSPQLASVEVPNLVGKTTEEAQKIAINNKLILELKEVIPPGDTPEGIILEQVPAAGREVKIGKTIFISVSKGQENLKVPNLIGRPLSQIYVVLQEMGLVLGEIEIKASKEYPNNTVIAQKPGIEQEIKPGSSIDITISINPDSVVD